MYTPITYDRTQISQIATDSQIDFRSCAEHYDKYTVRSIPLHVESLIPRFSIPTYTLGIDESSMHLALFYAHV